jgi:DNA-binding MarR family transcriptional regulator
VLAGNFWIGKTEVTFKQWTEVYNWAQQNGYSINSEGLPGSNENFPSNHPVTTVCLRDAIVWCNALTQFYNEHNGDAQDYTYAYTYGGTPVKDSDLKNTRVDDVYYDASATGFRVPLNSEWKYAASYPNTPEDYASGASASYRKYFGIGIVEWRIIALLKIEPNISANRICQIIGIDKAAASRALKALVSQDYVNFVQNEKDARSTLVSLTDAGIALHDSVIEVAIARENILLDGLSAEEIETLLQVLRKLNARVEQVNAYEPDMTPRN